MDDQQLAERFVASLRAGNPPWRFPHNLHPDFEPLFGKFYVSVRTPFDELGALLEGKAPSR